MGRKVDPVVSAVYREMGKKGGRARADKLTAKQRSDIARKAVRTRIERMKAAARNGQ